MVARESNIGSDVAQQLGTCTGEEEGPDDPGLQYRFVTNKGESGKADDPQNSYQRLRAIHELVIGNCTGAELVPVTIEEQKAAFREMYQETVDSDIARMKQFSSYHGTAQIENISKRMVDPINDYTPNDFALCSTFPTVFPLGVAYSKPIFKLSSIERNHLLRQFSNIPASTRRLLFYIYDTKKRNSVACGVNAYVNKDHRSVDAIKNAIENPEEKNQIRKAIANPNTTLAKNVLQKYIKHLRFAGKDVSYGPMEMTKLKGYVLETCKRYGPCSAMLTLAFSEPDNTRGIRATFATVSNEQFPSHFENDCEYGSSVQEFMQKIRDASSKDSTGNIPLPDNLWGRAQRRKRVMDNPVAFVAESKAMINDICSILLGCPPGDFFSSFDSQSSRKTTYFKLNKGIFGSCLAYIGVVEDHAKGTLHYHILFFGGLSPFLLQRFSTLPDICAKIGAALDTMYKSSIPVEDKLPYLVKKVFSKRGDLGLGYSELGDLSFPPLLNPGRMSFCTYAQKLSPPIISSLTSDQGCQQQAHDHMPTCRKGFMGLTGCRLCMPAGFCDGTHPVYLAPPDQSELDLVTEKTPGEPEDSDADAYRVHDPVPPGIFPNHHKIINPSAPVKDEGIVVWETDRPMENTALPSHDDIFGEYNRCQDDAEKIKVGDLVRVELSKFIFSRLCGYGPFFQKSPFWKWFKETDFANISSFYKVLLDEICHSNGNIATFNPILSLCTGSHNNASLLGSLQQAKGAVFYLCPYLGKTKFPLQQALLILNETINHVEK
jgi:hypothetical protein